MLTEMFFYFVFLIFDTDGPNIIELFRCPGVSRISLRNDSSGLFFVLLSAKDGDVISEFKAKTIGM